MATGTRKPPAKKAAAKKTAAKKTASSSSSSSSTSTPKGEDAINNDAGGTGPTEDNDTAGDARAAAAAAFGGSAGPINQNDDKADDQKPDVKVQIVEPTVEDEPEIETETVEKGFVFQHNLDPARQIPGTSKYLDFELRQQAEIDRARVEGREPDLENPPGMQGTPYRSADQINAELPYSANVDADVVLEVVQAKSFSQDKEENDEKSEGNTSNLLNKRVGVNT